MNVSGVSSANAAEGKAASIPSNARQSPLRPPDQAWRRARLPLL